jgi:hypothetical protein
MILLLKETEIQNKHLKYRLRVQYRFYIPYKGIIKAANISSIPWVWHKPAYPNFQKRQIWMNITSISSELPEVPVGYGL